MISDSEFVRLGPADLIAALNDKEIISRLRKDPSLLESVIDRLPEKTLADAFVKNKFSPREAVSKYPQSFVESFLEYGFNPGTDGILDLCAVSRSPSLDSAIAKLLNKFTTNKYDAGFVRSIMNLASAKDDIVITETLSSLMQMSSVALILLASLKERAPAAFIKVAGGLSGELRLNAAKLIDQATISSLRNGKESTTILAAFKLLFEADKRDVLSHYSNSSFVELLAADSPFSSQITDAEACWLLEHCGVLRQSYYGSQKISYRACYESLSGDARILGAYLNGEIPRASKFFIHAFVKGVAQLSAEDAFTYFRDPGKTKIAIGPILKSGSDSEMATIIRANSEQFLSGIQGASITPAVLRDAIGSSREEVAKAILEIVGSEFRRQIYTNYDDLKKPSKRTSKAEKHQQIISLIDAGNGSDFEEAICDYDSGSTDFETNLKVFLERHNQSTYKKKHQHLSLNIAFLKTLNDEPLAMRLIRTNIAPIRTMYASSGTDFLSADNSFALLNENRINVTACLNLTYEKERFLSLLSLNNLRFIDWYDREDAASIELAARLIAEKVRAKPGSGRVRMSSFVLLTEAAKLLTKEECIAAFACNPLEGYEKNWLLTFKDGEKFTAQDIMNAALGVSHRITDVLDALSFIEAKDELKEACRAILSPKATKFNELFPRAGNRNSQLKELATKILGEQAPDALNIKDTIKSNNSLSYLCNSLGTEFVSLLMTNDTNRRPTLVIDTLKQLLSKAEVQLLSSKYTLHVDTCVIQDVSQLNRLKIYLEFGATVPSVDLSRISLYGADGTTLMREAVEFFRTKADIRVNYGALLFEAALLEGCSEILRNYDENNILSRIANLSTLHLANKLGIPMNSSKEVAQRVGSDVRMLDYALEHGIRFDETVVTVPVYALENYSGRVAKAKSIGLLIMTEEQSRTQAIYDHVFEEGGELKAFEPISLSTITMSDRVDLIKTMMTKDARYKKVLTQDIGSSHFILNPPDLINKSILAVANLKEILGFGLPEGCSKEEKESLSELLFASGSLIGLAANNTKNLLSLAGLSDIRFDDLFKRVDGKVSLKDFAIFMGSRYEALGTGAAEVFSSIFKDPSKVELIALVQDGDDGYSIDFLKDTIRSLDGLRSEINRFTAILGEEDITASLILSAMSGDNAAGAMLDESIKKGGDAGDMLRDLGGVIKNITVTVSIARKRAKAGESVNLARTLHDELGRLVYSVKGVVNSKGQEKRKKIKSGFEQFNEELSNIDLADAKKERAAKTTIYFPANLGEIRELGQQMGWCTSYNDSYFEETIGGTAVLFNIKEGDKVIAQGHAKKDGRGAWIMSQIRYERNGSAERDFDNERIISILKEFIQKDTKLRERYLL
jgi:hypothetical protein